MIPKPLVQVTKADLQALITAQVRESKTIEYKRDLPGGSDEQKRPVRGPCVVVGSSRWRTMNRAAQQPRPKGDNVAALSRR
jgi:hypothetical protein